MSGEIELKAFTIQNTTIKTSESAYRQAKDDERLDHEYDVDLSGMDGETVIVEPDGTVVDPYGSTTDLFELLEPLLHEIPIFRIEQYAARRRAGAEE